MCRLKAICASVLVVVSVMEVSNAGVIFQDDFGGDLANPSALLTDAVPGNYPVLQGSDVGKQWMVRTPTTTGTSNPIVSRQWATQVRSDDPVTAGNNYLTLVRNTVTTPLASGGVFGYSHAQLSDANTTANTGRTVTVDLKVYIAAADRGATPLVSGTTGELLRVIGHPLNTVGNYAGNGDTSAAAFTGGAFSSRFYATGVTGFQTQGLVTPGDPTPIPTFKFDEWNSVRVVTNFADAVPYFTLSLTNSLGTMVSARQKLFTASATTIGTVELAVFNDSITRIDDVVISNDAPPPSLAGDFDLDGDLDGTDIDMLFVAQQGPVPTALPIYDLNADSNVNSVPNTPASDADVWVRTLKLTEYGDANLDGRVEFADLLVLAQNYGASTGTWASGDFDGIDGVQFGDLLLLAQQYGFGGLMAPGSTDFAADWALARSMVPEPTLLLMIVPVATAGRRRR